MQNYPLLFESYSDRRKKLREKYGENEANKIIGEHK